MIIVAIVGLSAFSVASLLVAIWVGNRFLCRWDTNAVRKQHHRVVEARPDLKATMVWNVWSTGWPDPADVPTSDTDHLEIYQHQAMVKATTYSWLSRTAAQIVIISISTVLSVLGSMWVAGQWEPSLLTTESTAALASSAAQPQPTPAFEPIMGVASSEIEFALQSLDDRTFRERLGGAIIGAVMAFVGMAVILPSVYASVWKRSSYAYRDEFRRRSDSTPTTGPSTQRPKTAKGDSVWVRLLRNLLNSQPE